MHGDEALGGEDVLIPHPGFGRGLDVFQRFELNEAFNFANRMQQHRQCKEFNVTFVRLQ